MIANNSTEESSLDEFYFQWHLTERCNRHCTHCYQEDDPGSELEVGDLLRIVDLMDATVAKWGRRGTLSLTGGEPFLRHGELHRLMERIEELDNLDYYDILTNGSLIRNGEAANLAQYAKLRRVQVSLEGATAETNDRIRGAGSFKSTLHAISKLREAGIAVSVMTTLTRSNKGEIPALVDLLSEAGVETFALERLIPEGTGAGMADEVLSAAELRELYESVYEIANRRPPVRILLYRPLFAMIAPEDPTVGALCSAGNNALTIMPDGTVYPCRRLPIPIGNVLTDGFFKIWYGSEVLWKLRNLDALNSKCRDCDLLTNCRGCRAMAYFTTGDYLGKDPQCWR